MTIKVSEEMHVREVGLDIWYNVFICESLITTIALYAGWLYHLLHHADGDTFKYKFPLKLCKIKDLWNRFRRHIESTETGKSNLIFVPGKVPK